MNNWYISKLIFAIHQSHQPIRTQFDEQLRLIEAKDKMEALIKARMIGIKEEHIFTNEKETEVSWQFIDVVELRQIVEFTDGMEIHSRIDEHDAIESYTEFVKHRGQLLVQEVEHSVMQNAVHV
jgi:hypothetical protein